MARKPKEGGVKLETIGVRVNAKQKYGLELLTRRYRQSISEVVSAAIDDAIEKGLRVDSKVHFETFFKRFSEPEHARASAQEMFDIFKEANSRHPHVDPNEIFLFDELWDAEEHARVVNLGILWPALLEYPIEELSFKIIKENKKYWEKDPKMPLFEKIGKDWEKIKEQAKERAK